MTNSICSKFLGQSVSGSVCTPCLERASVSGGLANPGSSVLFCAKRFGSPRLEGAGDRQENLE